MTLARASGILFLASIVWLFSSPDGASDIKFIASIAASVLCIVVLGVLFGKGAISARRARLAVAAFVWFVLGILYVKFLSPPTDIGGNLLAGLGMLAMLAVAGWMIVDGDLTAKRPKDLA